MTFAVDNLVQTQACLTKNGIKTQDISSGRAIRVQPNDACGVLLEFMQNAG